MLTARSLEPAVIMNDYQNAGVDAGQLRDLAGVIQAITGNCVCCGSREDLLETLRQFAHHPGRLVLVETNGTTDSEQLVEMLSLEAGLQSFSFPVQLSTIDAKRWQKRFWHNTLEREQACAASHLFVSRVDQVDASRLKEVENSLRERTNGQRVTPESFAGELAALTADLATRGDRDAKKAKICSCGQPGHGHLHTKDGHHHEAISHFASLELALPDTVEGKAFRRFLAELPDEVIRAKGMVRFRENPDELFVFQKVDRFDEPQFFPAGSSPRISTPLALFIGPRLSETDLTQAISRLTVRSF